jgi:hypothetical protein
MLAINSFPNLLIVSFLSFILVSTFEHRRQFPHGLLLIGRQILSVRLRLDHQQIERAVDVMIEINHSSPATLAGSGSGPADFSHAARLRDHNARFGILCDEVDERLALCIVPNGFGWRTNSGVSATVVSFFDTRLLYAIGVHKIQKKDAIGAQFACAG